MKRTACSLLGLLIGCAAPNLNKAPTTRPAGPTTRVLSMYVTRGQTSDPSDAAAAPPALVHLDVYLIELPANTVADNSDFWKRIDEQAPGAVAAERLNRNGIRCGTVPKTEGAFFSQFFDRQPGKSRRSTVTSAKTDSLELELEKHVPAETLFVIGEDGNLRARSYQDCSNLLDVTFGPTPRSPAAVRVSVCPVVRSDRKTLSYTPLNRATATTVKDTDRQYDVGLTVDVPDDSFLVVGPGPDAAHRDNVGGRYLLKADTAEHLERVLVVVPTFLTTDGRPTRVNDLIVR